MMVWFLPWLSLLLFLLPSQFYSSSSFPPSPFTPPPPPLCHPHESSALLHFKNSLSIFNYTYCAYYYGITNPNSTVYWNMSRDCCTWSGVTCDEVSGHVVGLDLGCSGLHGIIHSNNSLFLLTHLQTLILSHNWFYDSKLSPEFGRFSSMIHLDLSDSGFTGQLPLEFSYLSSLVTLDLSLNNGLTLETFSFKRIISNLTSLKELGLSDVNMSSVSINSLKNLSEPLVSLDLSFSALIGKFPVNIFHLPNLQELILSYNRNLNGSFPRYNWTSPLRELGLSQTGFILDVPYLVRNLKQLTHLDASVCGLTGSFPALSGNITQITSLDLSGNNFGGQFPWDFLNLEKLTSLDLRSNNFEGQLPEICSNSTKKALLCDSLKNQSVGSLPLNLKSLYLSFNLLNGTIPSWLCSLPSLQSLELRWTQFTGHLCEFQHNSLVYLDLSSNKLQGLIPTSIFQQVNLSDLNLSSNNFSGIILLGQFSKLKNLQTLDLSFNSISMDSINSIILALPNTLQYLALSSCNITGFPYSLRSLENLEELDLSNNRINGIAPQWLWSVGNNSLFFLNISHNFLTHVGKIPWKNLNYIDLSSNQLQDHLPIPPPYTVVFSISNNQLVGEVSSLFCNLSGIRVLDLSNNTLSGNIPPCLANFSSLSVLDLRMNRFHGLIPQPFSKGNNLRTLNLEGNHLEGPLPPSLINCEYLEVLDVGTNKLNGSFPFWLESLPELQVLILRSNRFSGPVSNPKVRFPFQKLRIIDLSNNEFVGLLPTGYFQNFVSMMEAHTDYLEYMLGDFNHYDFVIVALKGFYTEMVIQTMFISIDFSRNQFVGEIPVSIGKLRSLKGLNFSGNKLTGPIPASLGNITNLEWLDLSSNDLIGQIPLQLVDLTQLEFLNLSLNKLVGPIPSGKQFNTFNNDSYRGNLGLCGFPLSKSCSNDEARHDDQGDSVEEHGSGMIDWKVVMMGYASGLVIGISIGYMVLFSRSFNYWFYKRFGGGRRRRTNRGRRRSN